MNRMKQFATYALMVIVFWILSDILIYFGLVGMYKNFSGKVITESPKITINESKATRQSGFIKGTIKNDTDSKIEEKYIKIDLFSERDTYLGSKYLKVENLESSQEIPFESRFNFSNIYRYEVSVVDKEREYTEQELISDEVKNTFVTGMFLTLLFY